MAFDHDELSKVEDAEQAKEEADSDTASVGLGLTGLIWLYCRIAIPLGKWPRPNMTDPKDFLPELQMSSVRISLPHW